MEGGHIMVVLIVAIVMIAGVLRAKYGHERRRKHGGELPADTGEARRLREEVARLKERVQTLERITVDKEHSLAREIEDLRSHP